MRRRNRFFTLLLTVVIAAPMSASRAGESESLVLELSDYAAVPITGRADATAQTDGLLARVNGLVEEPGGASRFFVNDLRGNLYILDKASKQFSTYLDFNGRDGRPGLFHKFTFENGFANGLITVVFDPEYRRNGRFYTVHLEEPEVTGSTVPDPTHVPGLSVSGYTSTTAIATPGEIQREAVLVGWIDSNISNATFEGTAREILRIRLNNRIHPLSALTFNPAAREGDADWRVLYLGCGDGGSGESRQAMRQNPQRLDTVVGKILRIIPAADERVADSVLSENGRYRIPRDNPFVNTAGARGEIWAYGFRNPHRLTWVVDATNRRNDTLIADSVGLHTWETVNIVHKGANYGYSMREGIETLKIDNKTEALPEMDQIPIRISDKVTAGTVTPTYPVIQYPHAAGGGDAIGSGFVYRGRTLPALRGKYVFTDISTGRIWYADYNEMLAADDGKPQTLAALHELRVALRAASAASTVQHDTLFPIVESEYHRRGGHAEHLPGMALVSAVGRADAQLATDANGELYVLTKSDGMIRAVVGAATR